MDFQEYVKFANEHPLCYIATADGDQPRVRPFMMLFADDTGFYFQTASPKAVYKELQKNQKVELSFYAPGPVKDEKVLRVAGEVEFLDDIQLKTKVFKERPFLKGTGIQGPEDPKLIVFRVGKGEAYLWTIAYSLRESEIEKTKF